MGQRPTLNTGEEPNEESNTTSTNTSANTSANSSASSTNISSNYTLYPFEEKKRSSASSTNNYPAPSSNYALYPFEEKKPNNKEDEDDEISAPRTQPPPPRPSTAKVSVDSRGKPTLPVHLETIEDLLEEYNLTRKDLYKLLSASKKYVKVSTESSGYARTLVLTAYFRPSVQTNPPHTVRVSTFHDIKEVMHDYDSRTIANSCRRFLVMGAKRKQEHYDGKEYQLQYWCQFEVLFEGEFIPEQTGIPYLTSWEEPARFERRCRGEAEMYFANILDESQVHGTLVCRENKEDTLFSLKWKSIDDNAQTRPFLPPNRPPATPIEDLDLFENFLKFQTEYQFILPKLYGMLKWDPLSYAKFIEAARELYNQKFEGLYLTRLDAMVE